MFGHYVFVVFSFLCDIYGGLHMNYEKNFVETMKYYSLDLNFKRFGSSKQILLMLIRPCDKILISTPTYL